MNIQHEGKQFKVPRWVKLDPTRKVTTVKIVLEDRGVILLPMLDVIHAEFEKGKHIITGKVFDVFD